MGGHIHFLRQVGHQAPDQVTKPADDKGGLRPIYHTCTYIAVTPFCLPPPPPAPLGLALALDERVQKVLGVKEVPNEPVKAFDALLRVTGVMELGRLIDEEEGQHHVAHNHDGAVEHIWLGHAQEHGHEIVQHQQSYGCHGDLSRPEPGSEGLHVLLLVPFDVGQILRGRDDHREACDEACDECNGKLPLERNAKGSTSSVVHPVIQQEPPAQHNARHRWQWPLLETERGHAVDGPDDEGESVKQGDVLPKESVHDRQTDQAQRADDHPSGGLRHLPRRYR
mmetsp:Transcript_5809/g.17544  ORF Transcript_5809/g.17544 Transcript_5809/m.17544 type:complete len:281 (-) Transcript_5809:691-1533(-)